ncbi:hypothetical protein ROHU_009835 [Labeo rohita]|uniref:Uncharacterized protein n=1 Tax=Labeo rohita TaxID=84645 RepID=A0A498M0S0_LABRO|nr:hypothetical protein ROHU_009835 [Labeo rohita]
MLCCKTSGEGQSRAAPGAEEGDRGTGQKRHNTATHWRDCWRRPEHSCTQYNSSVSAHNPTAGTQTPNTSTNSAQQQRCVSTQSQSSFTPATRQSPQAHHNLKRKDSSSTQIHPPTTTSSSTSNGREQKRKDNIVILCDSNGHHLDPRRLFPGRSVKKFWCPTSHSALRLLQEGVLGAPSHIIIHTGTIDLSTRRVDVTKAVSSVVRTATRNYPRAKVIISSLLPRRDVPQKIINTINVEIANICAPILNVHITNHQQITHQHLYDHIHIHREGMRLFAKTIKASTLNSPQKTYPDREESRAASQQPN